jgi:putative endonuclease
MRWPGLNSLLRRKASAAVTTEHAPPQVFNTDAEQVEVDREPATHLALGQHGEELASIYLERQGYKLVAANFKLPVGRSLRGALVNAEIDLIAYEGRTLCFVEVKTRASDWYAAPEANVDLRKQRQVARAARAYRRLFGLINAPYRYDVVSVILPPANTPNTTMRIELLRNFWTDEKFRKRRWSDTPHDF